MAVKIVSKSALMFQVSPNDPRIELFAGTLRHLRTKNNLTQNEVCERAGITQPQYSAIENGHYEPAPSLVFRLETAVGSAPGSLSRHLGYLPMNGCCDGTLP